MTDATALPPPQPAQGNRDIFISYSRRDQTFVRDLYAALTQAGQEVWVDWEEIPAIADWRQEIYTNIEATHSFVFVLSPNSLQSVVCQEELEHAIAHGKRLMPIVCADVDPSQVHPELARLNWIFFRDFGQGMETLLKAISTDLDHIRSQTRLLVRAREWETHNRDESFLLRGRDLETAEDWLQQATAKEPPPTALQKTYIQTSRRVESDRQAADLSLRRLTPQQYRNRQTLLSKVNNFWVKNVLEMSLHGQALLDLGLEERRDLVNHPWDITWQTDQSGPRSLPSGTQLMQLFDQMGAGRSLLILGDPGSGKTTTLLELARDLIARAEQDIDQLIPVVFNLSSWMGEKQAIAQWLIEELTTKYQVPKQTGTDWVQGQQLLLLLDGLDEVQADRRDACVQALNQFSQQSGTDLVICSRIKDYEALSNRLQCQAAILIQPLSLPQIDRFFQQSGPDLTTIRTLLQADPALQELAKSPLMLSIMTLAYRGMKLSDVPTGSLEDSRRHLFSQYTDRMLQRRGNAQIYPPAHVKHWLHHLAQQMQQQSQTVFLIEQMQPQWLPRNSAWIYQLGFGLIFWTLTLSLYLPTAIWIARLLGATGTVSIGILMTLVPGVIWAMIFIALGSRLFSPLGRLLFACASGIVLASLTAQMLDAPLLGLLSGIGYAALLGIAAAFVDNHIHPIAIQSWSWGNARRTFLNGMQWGLIFGAFAGLGIGLIDAIRLGITFTVFEALDGSTPISSAITWGHRLIVGGFLTLANGFTLALIFQLLGGVIRGVTGGFSGTQVTTTTFPNQGIWESVKNMGIQSLIGAVGVGLTSLLIGTPIIAGIFLGLLFGLSGPGLASLKHLLLRLVLYWNRRIPWNYARFLDYATSCILLQKVGGGYIFIHRLLLEHFAALDSEEMGS